MILSNKILVFNVWLTNLVPYFIENTERFGFSEDVINRMNELWEVWMEKYKSYTSVLTNGGLSTETINEEFEKIFKHITFMKNTVKNNSLLKLTVEDLAYLGEKAKTKTVSKIAVTAYAPTPVVLETTALGIKLFAMDPKNLSTKKKPPGADKIGYLLAYTPKDALADESKDFKKMNPEKKSIFEVLIPADKTDMNVWLCVYYISPTGEEGRHSTALLVKQAI